MYTVCRADAIKCIFMLYFILHHEILTLKPHFYIVKLGFIGVYIIFLFLLKNINCWYSLDPPRQGGSNEYPQSMFWAGIWKMSEFFLSDYF